VRPERERSGRSAADPIRGRPILVSPLPTVAWRFLTNHGRALLCISHDPGVRIRDLALMLDITERSAQKIVSDLARGGYVTRQRVGRRNEYEVHVERPLPIAHELNLRQLLDTFSLDDDVHETVGS
jgi:hypothetical protein